QLAGLISVVFVMLFFRFLSSWLAVVETPRARFQCPV
ncbi:uncharacterized protein METZ01_LOCUS386892, partial [marine metagenome]